MKARCLLFAFVCLLAGAVPALAQRTLLITDFAADVRVNIDGTIDVSETIRAQFNGTWNGLYRTIPVDYRTPQGFNYMLRLDVQAVTDAVGNSLRYESSRERNNRKLKIYVPGAVDASRTIIVKYRVQNGLKFFDEHDELYWNVTGDEWDVPIERARATIHLPAAVQGIRTAAFTGGYGSQASAATTGVTGADVTVDTTRSLSFHEGLTLAVAWNPGVVMPPTPAQKAGDFVRANGVLLIPVGVLGLMTWLWMRTGRDPRRRPIAVQYEPPATLTPAEVGTLVDNSPDMRDITASIVDLAVRGYVRIQETHEARFLGLGTKKEYAFSLLRPAKQWKDLQPHEEALLSALFSHIDGPARHDATAGDVIDDVKVSDLRNTFYKHLPAIKDRIFDRLIGRGYYLRRPDQVKGTFAVVASLVALGGIAAAAFLNLGAAAIVAALVSGAIIGGFGFFMPARTVAGTRALESTLGFEEFLDRVEADRLERVVRTPEMFERFLPFAMALGVEHHWARAFEGIYTAQPGWYAGPNYAGFGTQSLVMSLGNLSSDAGTAMASAPRSSGGSGFGGGGFSGGGFGGGGGGGF